MSCATARATSDLAADISAPVALVALVTTPLRYLANPTPTSAPATVVIVDILSATSLSAPLTADEVKESSVCATLSSPPDNASVAPVAWLTPPTQAMNELVTFCREPETVCGMLANSPCNAPNWLIKAGTTLSIVSCPWSAMLLRSLRATPIPAANARITRSPASLTALNSSPRRTPCASAWLN